MNKTYFESDEFKKQCDKAIKEAQAKYLESATCKQAEREIDYWKTALDIIEGRIK